MIYSIPTAGIPSLRDSASGQKNSIVVDVPNSSSLTSPVTASLVIPAFCLSIPFSMSVRISCPSTFESYAIISNVPGISRPLFSLTFIVCLLYFVCLARNVHNRALYLVSLANVCVLSFRIPQRIGTYSVN